MQPAYRGPYYFAGGGDSPLSGAELVGSAIPDEVLRGYCPPIERNQTVVGDFHFPLVGLSRCAVFAPTKTRSAVRDARKTALVVFRTPVGPGPAEAWARRPNHRCNESRKHPSMRPLPTLRAYALPPGVPPPVGGRNVERSASLGAAS